MPSRSSRAEPIRKIGRRPERSARHIRAVYLAAIELGGSIGGDLGGKVVASRKAFLVDRRRSISCRGSLADPELLRNMRVIRKNQRRTLRYPSSCPIPFHQGLATS
jgi:hypothetical protein